MALTFEKARRKKVKLRLSISSPTGFGKTYSSLLLAHGLVGDWEKIAVIDTENRSASLYADLGEYNTVALEPPFTTEKYIEAIRLCESNGMECIIVDSITHVWKGEGGLLEYQNALGGRYQDWAKATPLYQRWLNTILHSPAHIITTMRKKQAYTISEEGGKKKVEKAGLEDEIRDGYDYEMTIAFEVINDKHLVKQSKDRTRLFVDKPEFIITEETGRLIRQWCESGVDPDEQLRSQIAAATTEDELRTIWEANKAILSSSEKWKALVNERKVQINAANQSNATTLPNQ